MNNEHHDEQDHHDDEQDEHDDHDNDDVMHDMHTNTMHHAWCNAWYKGNTQHITHKCIKTQKTKEMLQKHAKIFKGMNQQWRSKKPWQQNETNKKGAPTR